MRERENQGMREREPEREIRERTREREREREERERYKIKRIDKRINGRESSATRRFNEEEKTHGFGCGWEIREWSGAMGSNSPTNTKTDHYTRPR